MSKDQELSTPKRRSLSQMMTDLVVDDGSGLVSMRDVLGVIEEAEGQHCPEDYGFVEWVSVLEKRDGHMAHGYLQALVSLLLQTRTPIGPMRDRKDYPSELQDAINYLHGRTPPSETKGRWIPVGERLPHPHSDDDYIVATRSGYVTALNFGEDGWYSGHTREDDAKDGYWNGCVTHWQELPPGPTENKAVTL